MPESEPEQKKKPEPQASPAAPVLVLQGSRPDIPLPASVAASIDQAMMAMVVQPLPQPVEEPLLTTPEPEPVPEQPQSAEPEAEPVALAAEPAWETIEPMQVPTAPQPEVPAGQPSIPATPQPEAAPPKREVPKYEWPKGRPRVEEPPQAPPPAPAPEPAAAAAKTPLGEILVLYLSALLAILAVGLLVYLEMQGRARDDLIVRELASLREAVDALEGQAPATPGPQPLDFPTNDGTIDAILALQARINALEQALQNAPLPTPTPIAGGGRTQFLDEPTTDCIPVETRFLALTGEPYPICRTNEVVQLDNITADSVTTETGANVVEGGFTRLAFGNCTLLVISADVEGFAELRVTCS